MDFVKYPNGVVQAFGYKNGKLYFESVGNNKEDAFFYAKQNADNLERFGSGWEQKISPLNEKAWRDYKKTAGYWGQSGVRVPDQEGNPPPSTRRTAEYRKAWGRT